MARSVGDGPVDRSASNYIVLRYIQGMPMHNGSSEPIPTRSDYESLAAFRYALRRFMAFSSEAAQREGLTPTQHQALLGIKGHPDGSTMTIGQLADCLIIAPHTAAELVARLEQAALLEKKTQPYDRRRVGLHLTRKAERILRRLSDIHLQEICEIAPSLITTLHTLLADRAVISKDKVEADV